MSDRLDTHAARAAILARIRSRQGRGPDTRPAEAAARDRWLAEHPPGPLPTLEGAALEVFEARARALETQVQRLATWAEAPAALARWLAAQGLAGRGLVNPDLAHLPWAEAGLALEARPPGPEDLLAVTGCYAAVAETGSLVFASGPARPAGAHLLPETHAVLLPAGRIFSHLEAVYEAMRRELGAVPRGFNTVSGPSRTADIEQTIVIGAHGPYRVLVLIVEDVEEGLAPGAQGRVGEGA